MVALVKIDCFFGQSLTARLFSHTTAVANVLNQSAAQEQDVCLFYVAMAMRADVNDINRGTFQCGEGPVVPASVNISHLESLLSHWSQSVVQLLSIAGVNAPIGSQQLTIL